MMSAMQMILSATLGLGLVALSAVCVVLWRRVRALSAIVGRPGAAGPPTVAVGPPEFEPTAPRVVIPTRPPPALTPSGVRADRAERAGPVLIAVPTLATSAAPGSGASPEMDRRFGDVWALADAGTPAGTIAARTGYPVGQVELILGLRRRLSATAEAGSDA